MTKLDLRKDIVEVINNRSFSAVYDLPYMLSQQFLDELKELVDNAPTAYSFEMFCSEEPYTWLFYPKGGFYKLRLVNLEDD